MGQQFCKAHLENKENSLINSNTISADGINDDIHFLYPQEISSDPIEFNRNQQISKLQINYVKQLQNHLFQLSKSSSWNEMNDEIKDKFLLEIDTFLANQANQFVKELDNLSTYQEQLKTSFETKLKADENRKVSVFASIPLDSSSYNGKQEKTKQLSCFAIQSLTSILLLLIKSVEKNDRTLIHQILTLAGQLCEQLPMNSLSSNNDLLFKSLEPLTNYIEELSSSTDPMICKQTTCIRLCFSIAKGSFQDLLILLNELIFNTTEIFNLRTLFIQMNQSLIETINQYDQMTMFDSNEKPTEFPSLDYFKSIGVYPTTELLKLNTELLTGQFISSIILSHIDITNDINSLTQQLNFRSFSSEFHPTTFQSLFHLIERLTPSTNNLLNQILTICIKLFTTHLQLLLNIRSHIKLSEYASNDHLNKWFLHFSTLACNESFPQIAKEASKAFLTILNIQSSSSIAEKFTIIHRYILENKHPILIEQLCIELNTMETLRSWIIGLDNTNEKTILLEILYSFLELYFHTEVESKSQIEKMLISFQSLMLSALINQEERKILLFKEMKISSLIIEYLTHIFRKCMKKIPSTNDLFNSILLGLCLMTESELFAYEDIQTIFIAVLPLLAEYHLENESNVFISCLIGRICHVLIIGSPQDPLEIKHSDQFKQPIFAGGYILDQTDELLHSNLAVYSQFQLTNEIAEEKELLMSISKNIDDGARLISKLKSAAKDKQRTLPKSIEQQANDACAAVFAVYVKHYRRINLVKSELLRVDENKPYKELLSLYEYANRVQTLFGTIKGQGGDCDELYQHIQTRTLFLLSSVKESDLIPIVKEDLPLGIVNKPVKKGFDFQRQCSRWSKARHVLKLLKNLFQACIRFKKLMREKKQFTEEKHDSESKLNRALDQFIYGDRYQSSGAMKNEEEQMQIEVVEKCLQQQQKRAMIRLMTYRFIQTFIQNLKSKNPNPDNLSIYAPYLRSADPEWSYFDHIEASNNQLKRAISTTYYSIIKLILPLTSQSNHLAQNLFYLLSLSYEPIELYHQMIEPLFLAFVSINQPSNSHPSLQLLFIAFNWFRLYVFQLCEYIEMEKLRQTNNPISQQEQRLVFNTLILNEIKENLSVDSEVEKRNSLKDISLGWFLQANESIKPNELYVNQYLAFLLRSIRFYKNVVSICGTMDYLQVLLDIYHHHQSNITGLLVIKLLRSLIPYTLDDIDGISRNLIEKFLSETLNTISEEKTSVEIQAELIDMYRIIMSIDSPWRAAATDLVLHSINSYLNVSSIETNDRNQINQLSASLSILGGSIESYRLGSLVKIDMNDEGALALMIEIDQTEKPYVIQYFETNQIESVSIDKLRLKCAVLPPNSNDSILDTLGDFIQIDTSKNDTLIFSQLKRRSLSVLYHLLTNKRSIEIFMNKPYASVLAKLCLSGKNSGLLTDLRVFNREHLERYCLSLDHCKISEDQDMTPHSTEIIDSKSSVTWNTKKFIRDQRIVDALSLPTNGWKPSASPLEIEYLKKGRRGDGELSLVPVPRNITDMKIIEECGVKHRFHGRIAPNYDHTTVTFPTFIFEDLQLTEGKWYYCVRLPVAGLVQIGWATDGFNPGGPVGVGDDKYSWSYDGSRGILFWGGTSYRQFDNLRWQGNDVCGCGIEIDGENTNIKYWLNGKLLGTPFAHNHEIPLSTDKCDLLPNESKTTYYPSVTIEWPGNPTKYCELIVSPEDMQDCPLPNGYKPLLLPKLVQTENSIVEYPYHAYLIGENGEDFFLRTRMNSPSKVLRDFVHEQHLQTTFPIEDHHLILPDQSGGLSLILDTDENSSLTISFDFEILSKDDQQKFSLIKCNSTEITWTKTNNKQQCTIVFLAKEQQIKVYTNEEYQTFNGHAPAKNSTIDILPSISARVQNVAVWKYALPEEQISRLFTYGLFYIANDDKQIKMYRKRVNTITFAKDQQEFVNDLLVPFNESFTEEIWQRKKKQADDDESKYFHSHKDYSTIDFYGNQTYLVLNKSDQAWSQYTFILDLLIPHWPKTNELVTLISWDSKVEISITHNGKLSLQNHESSSAITPNEYFRLYISAHDGLLQIYLNEKLEIDLSTKDDQYQIEFNRIDLFKETNPTKNTTDENTLRLSFKSITYLDRSVSLDQLQSPRLIALPLEKIAPNLVAMGYEKKLD